MRVTLFGCGSWGSRIARRLADHPDVSHLAVIDEDADRAQALGNELGCAWSFDPFGYLGVTGTQTSSVEGGAVVIATPPSTRLALVRAAITGYGHAPRLVRVEKPLAETAEDAQAIFDACYAAGSRLSVGFTLLHHPLYEAAFGYAEMLGGVREVRGMRIGRPPAHAATPLVDLGIHTASIAAWLDVPCKIIAEHDTHAEARTTILATPCGDVVVDELDLTVSGPHGRMRIAKGHDALGCDINAWLAGTHRGRPDVALRAQHSLTPKERACVA